MRYKKFTITNFKGIQHLELDLSDSLDARVFTLVGLNESGKTTILEALSFFNENLATVPDEKPVPEKVSDDVHDLIPKQSKANFNGTIRIECAVHIDAVDKQHLEQELKRKGYILTKAGDTARLTHTFQFKNSVSTTKQVLWDPEFSIKSTGAAGKGSKIDPQHPAWGPAWEIFKNSLPPIIYYPNFLFNFPDKIFLEKTATEGKEQEFYRKLLQDILDALKNNLALETHILARAKSSEARDRDALESVLNKMGSVISRMVFNKDLNIFHSTANRSISVSYPKIENGRYYVELKLKDGEDSYYVRERSLGFRWFFTFLLFTQFRAVRKKSSGLIFLFDEPASNLHPAAQQKILRALGGLTTTSDVSVIYSTHSHHLINPEWLETVYIVKNMALDYDEVEEFLGYNTNIVVEKYRRFVGRYPKQRNYFQPILDVLEYKPSNLEDIPNVVMLEGKTDFYAYTYFQTVLLQRPGHVKFLPGTGSGNLGTPIQLYLAWGRDFIVLLDSDTEGVKQSERYIKLFGQIIKDRITTYIDVDPTWQNLRVEGLLTDADALLIQAEKFPDSKEFEKGLFSLAVQELLLQKKAIAISDESKTRLAKVFAFLEDRTRIE